MKKTRFLFLLACVLVMVAIFSVDTSAQMAFYTTTIDSIGPQGLTVVNVMLSDTDDPPAFTRKWFRFRQGREKEMMAITLTAMSMDWVVTVYTDPYLELLSDRIIDRMYLDKP